MRDDFWNGEVMSSVNLSKETAVAGENHVKNENPWELS